MYFLATGSVNVNCDITNEPYSQPIDDKFKLVVKFGSEYNDENEDILIVSHGEYEINVSQYTQPTRIFRLPGNTTCIYEIDYWYNSTSVTAKRQGSLTIMVDYANNDVKLVDECEYIGNSGLNENISFSAELSDENTDATLDTLVVKMVNSTTSDSGKLRFDVKTKIEQ